MAVAIVGSAVVGAGASIYAGNKAAGAARDAARVSARAARQARADLAPFREAGVNALGDLSTLLGLGGTPEAQSNSLNALTASPGFQFRLGQGINALDQSAVARGGLLSGNQLKAVNQFGQGLASQEFGNRFNQLFSLSGLGENAAAGQGNAGLTGAANQGQALIAAGQAQAAGIRGASDAFNTGIENAIGAKKIGLWP